MSGHPFYDDHRQGRNLWYIWLFGGLFIWIVSKLIPNLQSSLFFNTSVEYPTTMFFQAFFEGLNTGQWFYNYLFASIPVLLAIWLVQTKARQRPFHKLIQPNPNIRFRWRRFLAAILVFAGLMALYWLVYYTLFDWMTGQSVAEQLGMDEEDFPMLADRWSKFYFFAIIMLPLVVLNALAQEMAFRGYLDQGLTRYLKRPWAVFLLSSFLYAVWYIYLVDVIVLFIAEDNAHPRTGPTLILYFLNAMVFGFYMSILTYMDRGIEAAVGLNFAGSLLYEVALSPVQLVAWEQDLDGFGYEYLEFVDTLVFYLLALVVLAFWRFGLGEAQ